MLFMEVFVLYISYLPSRSARLFPFFVDGGEGDFKDLDLQCIYERCLFLSALRALLFIKWLQLEVGVVSLNYCKIHSGLQSFVIIYTFQRSYNPLKYIKIQVVGLLFQTRRV